MNPFDAGPSSAPSPGWLRQVVGQAPLLAGWLLVLALLPATPAARQSPGAAGRLAEAMAAYQAHDYDGAERLFNEALALAATDRDRRSEAEALRGLGITLIERARYDDADVALQRAFALFALDGNRGGIAKVFGHRATVADLMGRKADALLFARFALAEFEQLADAGERARAARRLLSLVDDPAEYDHLYVTAVDHAKAANDPRLEADLLHHRADRLFVQGRFAEADAELRRAKDLYEGAGDERNLARVLTSLGRLQRAHGAPELALDDFTRAFEIQTRVGDRQGALQSLNAMAVALGHLERHDEALTAYQQALELARQTGSARMVNFQTGNLGGAYLVRGETALAIPLLEVSASQETNGYTRAIRYSQVAEARFRQRAFAASVAAATEAIDAMRAGSMDERLFGVLHRRALAYQALGEAEPALADAREALATIERVRAQLVPDDFLKRGFHNENQDVYTTVIGLLDGAAEHEQALEVSEQARSRAFLDLLASRGLSQPATASTGPSPTGGAPTAVDPGTAIGEAQMLPMLRGAAGTQGSRPSAPSALPSPKAASSLPLERLLAEGARLRSTVISYWVDREHTIVWVAAPDQPVRSVRVDVTRGRLTRLVRAVWAGIDSSLPPPPPPIAAPSTRTARPAERELDGPSYIAPRRAARELYELLIGPIESALPRAEGSRLTIVPHGPLFRLSFAALLDRRNRYFIERHTLHYAPALSMLEMTGRLRAERLSAPATYLLVGNPASMPLHAGQPLPPLPGAAREVRAIARQLPSSAVTVLAGADATEQAVRDAAPGKRIVHFATHGVVVDEDPLASFLALGTVEGDGADTGRLTAAEVYRLPLDADLVVLSACRTGLGELSADGIVGLTRAFFSAGTPSLVATLWDVVDGPPATLLPDFYRSMQRLDKAAALRAAQLRLLRDLRAGRVMVDTPGGPVALPERPVFWASFVLMGEP
ncbi:MAG: CHAT domain-containing protein [Acidobacteria bacterium]|nr:CHAT domain-containing protein [Acidobacteriota bacterium]